MCLLSAARVRETQTRLRARIPHHSFLSLETSDDHHFHSPCGEICFLIAPVQLKRLHSLQILHVAYGASLRRMLARGTRQAVAVPTSPPAPGFNRFTRSGSSQQNLRSDSRFSRKTCFPAALLMRSRLYIYRCRARIKHFSSRLQRVCTSLTVPVPSSTRHITRD